MSGAEPCTASKIAASLPMFPPGASPRPAHQPGDLVGEDVAEHVLGDDHVEAVGVHHQQHRGRVDDPVLELDAALVLRAISRPMSRKSPCVYFRMFALWASVTLRGRGDAYSKA
jgi:hypothetical protein